MTTIDKLTKTPAPNTVYETVNKLIDAVEQGGGGGGGTATDVKINNTSITSNGIADIKTNGTYNSSSNKIATMSDLPSVPTKVSDLTNDAGYTSNAGTVTKVNNTSPDANGNVTLSIPDAQIQSDWNQTTTTAKDYIKNKPSIPTKVSQLTNDSGFTSNAGTITGIKMNGSTKGSSGVVDLGTVITSHQDISGKADKTSDNIFTGSNYFGSVYQKSTINPNSYVKTIDTESVDTYSANRGLTNLNATNSVNFDGQWVASKIDLPSMGTNVSTYKYNLKNQSGTGITAVNYLPNDNYQYEVSLYVYSSNTSYGGSVITVYSDIVSGNGTVAEKSSAKYGTANIILPVSSLLTVEIANNRVNNILVTLIGYRRIGTNS